MDIVRKEFESYKVDTTNLVEIKVNKAITIGNVKVFPVSLSHSIPDNFGYAVYTNDGVIFYGSDFVFDAVMRGPYQTDIGKLAYIGKQGVLCLLSESIYADRTGYTTPNHRIEELIAKTLNKAPGRIIFNVLNSHLYRIQELFNEVSKTEKKIVVMGKKLQNLINNGIANGYLSIDKRFIGDLSNLNDKNAVILNSNEREKPFMNLNRIINGYDKFVKIKPTDTVFFMEPINDYNEKLAIKVVDDISKMGASVVTMSRKDNLLHHASSEDIMLMLDLMNPKYYMPVIGEYRHMIANAKAASHVGMNKENIILKQNGDIVNIDDKVLQDKFEHFNVDDIFIDGKSSDDIGDLVIKDREMLSNNGIMIVSVAINKKTKKMLAAPEILTRGFIYVKDSAELIKELKEMITNIIINNTRNNYIEYGKVKSSVREELSKFLIAQTGNKPMIITVVQEI